MTQTNKSGEEFIVELLLGGLADQNGVHIETMLATLGALTGFATQMAVREKLINSGEMPENQIFLKIGGANGDIYYTGDILNDPLMRTGNGFASLYSVIGGDALSLGATQFPDVKNIIDYVASTYGSGNFGVPRIPAPFTPKHLPIDLLRDSWRVIHQCLLMYDNGNPLQWPYTLIGAIRHFIKMAKEAINPNAITIIIMETAIPMSHIDPNKILAHENPIGKKAIDITRSEAGKLLASDAFQTAWAMSKKNI